MNKGYCKYLLIKVWNFLCNFNYTECCIQYAVRSLYHVLLFGVLTRVTKVKIVKTSKILSEVTVFTVCYIDVNGNNSLHKTEQVWRCEVITF